MLLVQSLSCERDQGVLFTGLGFSLERGELLHVKGSNGAGKTTLLKILLGFYTEYEGEVAWSLEEPPAYISHAAGIKNNLTVAENLRWHCELSGSQPAPDRMELALAALGLQGLAQRLGGSLSEGQRKRANLARLLVAPRACWILDEPTAGLDANGSTMLHQLLAQHRASGGAAIVTSHQPMTADQIKTLDLDT
ncbi:MAG: heme ABC exporter ATP-binding protein CcmA [Pseudomonadales bacterium]